MHKSSDKSIGVSVSSHDLSPLCSESVGRDMTVHKSAQINVLAQAQDCVKNTHASRTERAF